MEQKESITTAPGGSDTPGAGEEHSIVPAVPSSSSYDGQSAMSAAGIAQATATAALLHEEKNATNPVEHSLADFSASTVIATSSRPRQDTGDNTLLDPSLVKAPSLAPESWVHMVEEEEINLPGSNTQMEAEDDDGPSSRVASKRKKARSVDSDSLDDSPPIFEMTRSLRPRASKKRIPANATNPKITSKDCEILTCSNPESAQSGTDRDDRRGKVGRPRRKPKAIDPIMAEQEILKQTGLAPEHIENEVLNAMTPSEISAQALEYTASIEMIRTKCGRIQGVLSGELRRRIQGLETLIRALQIKAEATGDPIILQTKIDELLEELKEIKKKREREEERRKREYSELQERIKELKKEREEIRLENREMKRANSEMRDEIRIMNDRLKSELTQIRESIDRESGKRISPEHSKAPVRTSNRADRGYLFTQNNLKKEDLSITPEAPKPQRTPPGQLTEKRIEDPQPCNQWPITGESWSSPVSKKRKMNDNPRDTLEDRKDITDWVWRPPLQGKSVRIPVNESLPSTSRDIPTIVSTNEKKAGIMPTGKKGIRLIGNVQIAPPRSSRRPWPESFASVLQRHKSSEGQIDAGAVGEPPAPVLNDNLRSQPPGQALQPQEWVTVGKKGKPIRTEAQFKSKILREKKKIPKTAAISIKGCKDEFSYADALQKVRTNISLKDLDIQNPRIRKGISGITIIEIPGPENEEKANRLAGEMQRILAGEALVSRPCVKSELKLSGLDESITTDEIRSAIASEGSCKEDEIKLGKIGVDRAREGMIWVQCPRVAAVAIAEKKKIQIGWTRVKVELLPSRPVQCHRCWRLGHVRATCKSKKDYTGICYRCGESGHKVPDCKNKPRCLLCSELRLNDQHRVGSAGCRGVKTTSLRGNPETETEKILTRGPTGDLNPDKTTDILDSVDHSVRRTEESMDTV